MRRVIENDDDVDFRSSFIKFIDKRYNVDDE
jgi:hypothetical protein